MKNKKGQAMILGLMFLFMTVIVLMALIPSMRTSLDQARHYDSLNCKSNTVTCSNYATDTVPCKNLSLGSETTSCLILDLYIPYIAIAILVGGVGALLAGKLGLMGQQQPQYGGGYQGY